MTQKMTLQFDPSKRSPLIHAHKAQGRAEIKIIRYMKQVKTEKFSNENILAHRRDNPSKFSLGGRPEYQL